MAFARSAVRSLSSVLVVGAAFLAGVAAHIVDNRTGRHLSDLAAPVVSLVWPRAQEPAQPAPPKPIAVPPADRVQAPARRQIESVLLPLVADAVAISKDHGIAPGQGGGITIVDDTIFIVDVNGSFARVSGKGADVARLNIPPLPNHLDDYREHAASAANPRPELRAHSIESRREAPGIRLFVSHEKFLPDLKTTALAVSSILISDKTFLALGAWDGIYQSQPLVAEKYHSNTAGGRMVVRGDSLYVTVGDYNMDNMFMPSALEAQNPDTDFGKILSIDLASRQKTVLSIGHRNPQGLVVTSKGVVYATEHGPRGGDALMVITKGKNFGWPIRTLGTHYTSYAWPNRDADSSERTFDKPVFAWIPSIAVSNLIEIKNFHPAWNGDLLVSSLRARSLYRLRQDGQEGDQGHVLYSEPIWIGERLRDLAALPDGTLVKWTDAAQLIFLTVDADKLASNQRTSEPTFGLGACEGCHHVGPTNHSHAAPSLSKLFGRKIASDNFDHYSAALSNLKGEWSQDNLLSFLTDPSGFAAGAPPVHQARPKDEAVSIIELLKKVN